MHQSIVHGVEFQVDVIIGEANDVSYTLQNFISYLQRESKAHCTDPNARNNEDDVKELEADVNSLTLRRKGPFIRYDFAKHALVEVL